MSGSAKTHRPRPTLAKIVATVGPASQSAEMVEKLIAAGVGVFRLNFSHGTQEDHGLRLRVIRETALRLGQPVAVLGDLQGPKIRLGMIPDPGVDLLPGQAVLFVRPETGTTSIPGVSVALPTEYAALAEEVRPGQRVLINDGAVRLLAVDPEPGDGDRLRCRVIVGGRVSSRKGINLPDTDVRAAAITQRDWEWVEWAVSNDIDFLALSFVRKADEVRQLKQALSGICSARLGVRREAMARDCGDPAMIPVIAKIEKPQAIRELDAIVEAADGIMVARGDLGVEMDLAQVPLIQKRIVSVCDQWGKPCIVATQMLESMIQSATPTRAEASDVANAILDGADAVMLSGETAVGKHPDLVVEVMRRIVCAAEESIAEHRTVPSPALMLLKSKYRTAALAHGAWHIARDIAACAVACWSQEGGTARYLSQTGLDIPILAYSSSERQVRRMNLLRSVTARLTPPPPDGTLAAWNAVVEQDLRELGWVSERDPVVLVAGKPLGVKGSTTAVAVHYIGDRATGFMKV